MQESMPAEEVRFAVVLNGGVSLAVWMGGVVLELDQVTRREGAYGGLLELLSLTARADVIAGTSAGGINGAALALAQVNKNADISLLRDLWAEQGRMETLLQRPFRGAPSSLLRGDDYFLPSLVVAMERLASNWNAHSAEDRPVDLTITTTLLSGAREVNVDSLGQALPQSTHEGRFYFRRGVDGDERDDFVEMKKGKATGRAGEDIAARLALAARATAGFPVAFEPTFIPAVATANGQQRVRRAEDRTRPDMGAFVSWRSAGPADELPADRSRFAVDGGLLANTPTRDALKAIGRMKASTPVRRVMLLVYPHAPLNQMDPADAQSEPPEITTTIGGLLAAVSSQGSRTFVDEVERHNQVASSRRGTRTDILANVGSVAGLHHLADAVFAHYQALRVRRVARDLAGSFKVPTDWSFDRIRKAVEDAQADLGGVRGLPYVPRVLPTEDWSEGLRGDAWWWGTTTALDLGDMALDLSQRLAKVASRAESQELEMPRQRVHRAIADIRAAYRTLTDPWNDHPVLAHLQPDARYWRVRAGSYAWMMTGQQWDDDEIMAYRAEIVHDLRESGHHADETVVRMVAARNLTADERESLRSSAGRQTTQAVGEVVAAMGEMLPVLHSVRDQVRTDMARLGPWHRLFQHLTTADDPHAALLARMLWLHVATWAMADEVISENTSPVDLVQISLQTENAFALRSRTADDKVGGHSLARFSGFLKRSWRQNDWTWGRCDAATMLMKTLLTPERIRRYAVLSGQLSADERQQYAFAKALVDDVVRATFGIATAQLPDRLQQAAERAIAETSALFVKPPEEGERDDPDRARQLTRLRNVGASLPCLAELAGWSRHAEIARQELPALAVAAKADLVEGGNRRSRGALFLDEAQSVLESIAVLPTPPHGPEQVSLALDAGIAALDALDRAGIGREDLADEGTSDQLIRTAATAASVAVTVADGPRSGLGAVKPVTRGLRGAMLLPYWTVIGLSSGGAIAKFLALMALSIGGLLLSLSLLGVLGAWSSVATAAGAAALLCAFAYAALRTGSLLHGIVLLTPVLPLLSLCAYLLDRGERGSQTAEAAVEASKTAALGTLGVVGLAILVLVVLGSIPAPLESPQATVVAAARRVRTWVNLAALLVAGVGVWLVAKSWDDLAGAVDDFVEWLGQGWGRWALVSAVLVGAGLSYLGGWLLREWRKPTAEGGWTTAKVAHPAGVAASWSAVYGTGYLLAGLLIAASDGLGMPPWAYWTMVLTCLTFAAVLLVIVPLWLPWRAHCRLRRGLCTEVSEGILVIGCEDEVITQREVRELLERRGQSYRYLLKPNGDELKLRWFGPRLAKKLSKTAASL